MVHGGTTFGLWSGANEPYKPETSSYDYDAPISEAGWATDKFYKTRELFSKYLLKGETLPEPPPRNPVVEFAPVRAAETAPVLDNLPAPVEDDEPRGMEAYGQGYGCILYRTTLPAGEAATLEASAIHDFGFVLVDGVRVGVLDRRASACRLQIPARSKDATLDVLVEAMGRINFGAGISDHKGLIAPVTLGGKTLKGWKVFKLPLDEGMVASLKFKPAGSDNVPAFWRTSFNLAVAGDTFLDLRGWGKGVLWVNGRCLGRFWDIGPTQTAYAPGCWLHAGANEVVILDLVGPSDPRVGGLAVPILDQLRPAMDFAAR
jgi:beta-galactosidase